MTTYIYVWFIEGTKPANGTNVLLTIRLRLCEWPSLDCQGRPHEMVVSCFARTYLIGRWLFSVL